MKIIKKEIVVQFDDIDSEYTVLICTDRDGTVFADKAKNLEDLLGILSKITKTRIVFRNV